MILIVDDETFAISMIERKLAPYKLNILTTTNVQDAITQISAHPEIKLVITDLHMPNASGFELLEWLFINAPEIKTIVTTAHSMDAHEINNSTVLRCDKILIKPLSVEDELLPAIKNLIQL